MNYTFRLSALRRAMKKAKCDALAISDLTNVRYLCGYTGTSGLILLTPERAYFLTDFRYQSQAAQQVPEDFKIAIAKRGLWREAARLGKNLKIERLGFEAEHVSVAAHQEIAKLFAPSATVITKRLVEDVRLHKDAEEIAITRRAAQIIDETFAHLCGWLRPGLRELEVVEEIERQIRRRGGSGTSFDTIVASGVRSSLPHGVASEKTLERGDLITIDMGALLDGYCSDFTRTVCLGKANEKQREIYQVVWEAQKRGNEAMRPGANCKAVDKIVRDVITTAGYGKFFGHGLGHGVGLQIHEAPRLSPLGKGFLESGMIVTCEPGIYLPDWGGVRIEDLILITDDGCEILSHGAKPREIIEL